MDNAVRASQVVTALVRAGLSDHYHFGSMFTATALCEVSDPVITFDRRWITEEQKKCTHTDPYPNIPYSLPLAGVLVSFRT